MATQPLGASLTLTRTSLLAALALAVVNVACVAEGALDEEALEGADDSGDGYGAQSVLGDVAVGSVLRATTTVNLRKGPGTGFGILHVVPNGATVTVVSAKPSGGFYQVKHGGVTGWSYGLYYDKISSPTPTPGGTSLDAIKTIAGNSACFRYSWNNRGQMPRGYVKGVALVFARAVCEKKRSDVVLVSRPATTDDARDALSWYRSTFSGLGMSNDGGVETLRHVYALLLGLGMRESSGQHCVGRDASATNTSSDSAEAGAWQTSWDSRSSSAELPPMLAKYRASSEGCFLETFREGVSCSASNWKNWGTGADGLDFQRISKACPAFAAEYAAVMLRVRGGKSGHYGPLRTKAAEVRPECDSMLEQVQSYVETNPSVCDAL